jgi:uncharacterized membrane protein
LFRAQPVISVSEFAIPPLLLRKSKALRNRREETAMATINTRNPVSSANFMGHPLHPLLITLPIGLFIGTFLCDLVFWWTANPAFATAAIWILGAGLIGAALAAVAGLIDFVGDARIRAISDAWQHAIGNVILVLVQLFSFYWRYRHGTAAVVPVGLVLSLVAVCIMLFTGWKGGELVFRHRVAVYDEPRNEGR